MRTITTIGLDIAKSVSQVHGVDAVGRVVISKMPDTNPLKRILTALSYRLGATLAAGALAIPLEPIPGIDVLYDIGVPIVLIWYWFTFFKNAFGRKTNPPQPDQRQVVTHSQKYSL